MRQLFQALQSLNITGEKNVKPQESVLPKKKENIEAFKEEIKNLVLNGERIEGTYRKAEPDGYPASHFYDLKTGTNAVFKKQTKEFISAWKLSEGQVDDLLTNGNVGDY